MQFVCHLQDSWLRRTSRNDSFNVYQLPGEDVEAHIARICRTMFDHNDNADERYSIVNLVTGEVIADRTYPTETPVYRLGESIHWPWWQFWK